jgi:hypothetical protein
MNKNIEKLINRLDDSKVQCTKCKKWINKSLSYGPFLNSVLIVRQSYCKLCWDSFKSILEIEGVEINKTFLSQI